MLRCTTACAVLAFASASAHAQSLPRAPTGVAQHHDDEPCHVHVSRPSVLVEAGVGAFGLPTFGLRIVPRPPNLFDFEATQEVALEGSARLGLRVTLGAVGYLSAGFSVVGPTFAGTTDVGLVAELSVGARFVGAAWDTEGLRLLGALGGATVAGGRDFQHASTAPGARAGLRVEWQLDRPLVVSVEAAAYAVFWIRTVVTGDGVLSVGYAL